MNSSLLPHSVISPAMFFVLQLILLVHLLSFDRAMCPTHVHSVLVKYSAMPVSGSLLNDGVMDSVTVNRFAAF